MARIEVDSGLELSCEIDDFLWPWTVAEPVLMVNGYARTARFWDRWIPTVANKRRIHRLELRGCGQSDRPPEGHRFEAVEIFQDVMTVMDTLGLEKVHWVGESSSGLLGIAFAATHPERIKSLVLCNTPFKIPDALKPTYSLDQPCTADAVLRHGLVTWCRRTLHLRLDLDRASPELQEWYCRGLVNTPSYVAAAYSRCFEAVDVTPLLEKVSAPALLLSGDKSRIAWEQQDKLKRAMPNAELFRFEGYGHGVNVLAPERCAQEAVSFWDRVESKS